jgi:hypothetical protein
MSCAIVSGLSDAVLAHGMAAVAFWRTGLLIPLMLGRLRAWLPGSLAAPRFSEPEAEEQI